MFFASLLASSCHERTSLTAVSRPMYALGAMLGLAVIGAAAVPTLGPGGTLPTVVRVATAPTGEPPSPGMLASAPARSSAAATENRSPSPTVGPPTPTVAAERRASRPRLPFRLHRRLAWAVRVIGRASAATIASVEPPAEKAVVQERRRSRGRGSDRPADRRRLRLVRTFSGGMAPKSIVADQRGRYFAMNVMYGHSITVFNRRYKRVRDISYSVDLSRYGYARYRTPVQGAPVEGAVSPDGRTLYVSNYSMYGNGFEHPGFDLCTARDRIDRSFVYAIDTRTLRKTDVIQVGEVPKYLAITPDGRTMLVGNWCSWDISVVDLRRGREVARIPAGVAPRGIAFSPNGRRAYVTLVGEDRILIIDMRRRAVIGDIDGIGERPRHLVMSPNGRYLYVTSEGKDKPRRVDGVIHKIATRSGRIVASSPALTEPRTTVMSDDGRALYVVDYYPGIIVKLATKDLSVIQERYLGYHPVGATYDNVTDKVWVAGYGGQVWVLTDR